MKRKTINTPIGKLTISEQDNAIVQINKDNRQYHDDSKLLDQASKEIHEYFAGKRQNFTFAIKIDKYPDIYEQLRKVPYGKTISYKQLAILCNRPKASRFIGNVMHENPLLLVVPCHRVIKSDGSLGGFGLGLDIKKYLLILEGIIAHER
ncbi:MAG: methylated-DNA--[protein]-cysteine S-methyltransferase [Erysipelotrichaceae bacterium]|nr:methylated-DNA--[protein]-cysteine S-methyltransferase [Erysipelotrichaceae bacterium]MDY5252504.1 methylated-DNA--[protein]-cysteine S-methyltransferase [Erysipelotrichaceae bacterium]